MSTSEPSRKRVARPCVVELEDHPLALAEHAEDRAVQRVGGEVELGEIGVAHDHAVPVPGS